MSWLALWQILQWTIRIAMVPVILRRRFQPVTSLTWLTLIFFLPEVGLLVYLLVGVSYLGRRRARSHERIVGERRLPSYLAETYRERPEVHPEQRTMIIQAEQIGGNSILSGNHVELLPEAGRLVDQLVREIDAAEHHVHLLYYIFWPDAVGERVIAALQRAARRGVQCRLLVDATGSRPLLRSAAMQEMRAAGVRAEAALPVTPWRRKLARLDLRNHRKIAVIDGRTAYTGSHNIVTDDYGNKRAGRWVDLSVRLTGPAVAQLQAAFLDDWAFETDERPDDDELFPPLKPAGQVAAQVVPTGPSHEAETFRRVLVAALNTAQRRIILTTPYLVLDEPSMLALAMAADRGVQVDVIVPRKSDHPLVEAAGRWYYDQLLDANVNVHLYTDGMLHAKTITVDDAFALLGSANLDIRSFYLNFEINVLLYGPEITGELRFAQQRYLAQSQQLNLEQWRARPILRQYVESAAALLSPIL
ncbi:MAG: cardiolipin synthase [Phycisphaeraceae bacterium]